MTLLLKRVVLTVSLVLALCLCFVIIAVSAIGSAFTEYHDDPSCAEDVSGKSDGFPCQCGKRSDARWAFGNNPKKQRCQEGSVKDGKCNCPDPKFPRPLLAAIGLLIVIIVFLGRATVHSYFETDKEQAIHTK